MMHRLRVLAALFALLALSLYWVEGVWASMCSAEMPAPAASRPADAGAHPPDCPMGEGQPERSPEPERRGSTPPPCPLVPAGATGCVGSAALLPTSAPSTPDVAGSDPSDRPLSHARDLLLAAPLLRPPRA